MQQPPDMIDVIVDAKTALHQLGHARTSPQVSVETSGLRTFEQQRFQPTFVLRRQFDGRPGAGLARTPASPRRRAADFQRRTLRRSTPTRRATSDGNSPSLSNANARKRRRSSSSGLPVGRIAHLQPE